MSHVLSKDTLALILEFIFISHGALILHLWKEEMKVEMVARWPRVRAAHATRVRDTIGALSAWCGGPRERGPHTCKRMLLKGRAEPKNRSLKCNDIVVFNARLFKTVPFVFLEPDTSGATSPPSTCSPGQNPFSTLLPFLVYVKDKEELIGELFIFFLLMLLLRIIQLYAPILLRKRFLCFSLLSFKRILWNVKEFMSRLQQDLSRK